MSVRVSETRREGAAHMHGEMYTNKRLCFITNKVHFSC